MQQALLPKVEAVADADKALHDRFIDPKGPLRWLALVLRDAGFEDIEAKAPAVLEYKLPGELVAGTEVVVNAALHPEKGRAGTAQFLVSLTGPNAKELLGQPIVVGAEAATLFYIEFGDSILAMQCYVKNSRKRNGSYT